MDVVKTSPLGALSVPEAQRGARLFPTPLEILAVDGDQMFWLDPRAKSHIDRGSRHLTAGHLHSAITELTRAVLIQPNPYAFVRRSFAFERAGRRSEAQRDLAASLSQEPSYPVGRYVHAAQLARSGRYEEALQGLSELLRRHRAFRQTALRDPNLDGFREPERQLRHSDEGSRDRATPSQRRQFDALIVQAPDAFDTHRRASHAARAVSTALANSVICHRLDGRLDVSTAVFWSEGVARQRSVLTAVDRRGHRLVLGSAEAASLSLKTGDSEWVPLFVTRPLLEELPPLLERAERQKAALTAEGRALLSEWQGLFRARWLEGGTRRIRQVSFRTDGLVRLMDCWNRTVLLSPDLAATGAEPLSLDTGPVGITPGLARTLLTLFPGVPRHGFSDAGAGSRHAFWSDFLNRRSAEDAVGDIRR